jgi:hypothetical protein
LFIGVDGYEFRGTKLIALPSKAETFDIVLFPDEKRIHAILITDDANVAPPAHYGYYYLNGDTLKICFGGGYPKDFRWGPDGEFPKQFAGQTHALLVLKRNSSSRPTASHGPEQPRSPIGAH